MTRRLAVQKVRALAIGARQSRPSPQAGPPPMTIRILVRLKPGVLDPQGRAVHHALESLGFADVTDVRIGRLIEMEVGEESSDADIERMCEQLLANTVIENYTIERMAGDQD
jgi:phosphoribosylformylglycinamidine synthase